MKPELVIIAHNIRSIHNVGALLRTCDGLGVQKVYLTGYTPYPKFSGDSRLPYLSEKIHKGISKTALGAESYVHWEFHEDVISVINEVKRAGFLIAGLEQHPKSVLLHQFIPSDKVAVLLGSEVNGISPALFEYVDTFIEIKMFGKKESFNVVEASSMALYHCRFML